jgi:hypothetical protein
MRVLPWSYGGWLTRERGYAGRRSRSNAPAVKKSTVKWSATFDGTQAKGKLALDPVTPFTLTREE